MHDKDCFNLSGYTRVAEYCRKDHIRGGSVIFVRSTFAIESSRISYLELLCEEFNFECCGVSYGRTCIVCIYRSVSGDLEIYENRFTQMLSLVLVNFDNVFICGDLNIDECSPDAAQTRSFFSILENFSLRSLISSYTRIFTDCNNRTSRSSVDYVICGSDRPQIVKVLNFHAGFSDHNVQIVTFKDETTLPHLHTFRRVFCRSYSDFGFAEFDFLLRRNLMASRQHRLDDDFDSFYGDFLWCFNAAFPKRLRNIRCCPAIESAIFPENLGQKILELEHATWLASNLPCLPTRNNRDLLKFEVDNMILSYRQGVFNDMIDASKNKTKTVWRIIDSARNKCVSREGFILYEGDREISDAKILCDFFGRYFSSVAQGLVVGRFPPASLSVECSTTSKNISNSMFFHPVTPEEVERIIASLPSRSSAGWDDIPARVVKQSAPYICDILADSINYSVSNGSFPDKLKMGLTIPIFKKGDRGLVDNYRPITMLSVFSKIFEKAVYTRLVNFIEDHSLFTECQHGFRPRRSTTTAICSIVQSISERLDNGHYVAMISFDLRKAFDCVDPLFLSRKLYRLGIRGKLNDWLISFLRNRRFGVRVEDSISREFDIVFGVPQGSSLGPLLFLLFINDLPEYILDGEVYLYADDTSVVISDPSPKILKEKCDAVLDQFSKWCDNNHLIINNDKTVCIEFHNPYREPCQPRLVFGGSVLRLSDQVTLLGCTFDKNLRWTSEIDNVCARLNRCYYTLCHLKRHVGQRCAVTFYHSNIASVLRYSLLVWGRTAGSHRAFVLQKRIVRALFGLDPQTSCRECFRSRGILTLPSMYVYHLMIYIHDMRFRIPRLCDHHSYNTRGCRRFYHSGLTHTFHEKSPLISGIQLYDVLPKHLTDKRTSLFRRELRAILANGSYYSVSEFVSAMRVQ